MNLRTKLQEKAFDRLKQLKVGALFLKMGKGKTRVAIELVDYNQCDLLIYIAPFSALDNIESEFKKWNLKTPYKLIGYETISMSDRQYLKLLNSLDNKKIFIIADESIFIKNDTSIRYKRLLQIRKKCEYALILNGTPLTKNEWDIYNQMYLLSPLIINMSRNQFQNTFFTHIKGKKQGKKFDFYKFSQVNADVLYRLIEPYIIYSNMSEKEANKSIIKIDTYNEDYEKVRDKDLKNMRDNMSFERIMALLTKLQIIASLDKNKMNVLINDIKDTQVIVYCSYIEEVEYIQSNIDCYVITGNVKNRKEIIKAFRNNNKPLIMTYGVGSYSLNLQFTNKIYYSSLTFDYAKLEQSEHRVNRIGQDREVIIKYYLADLGINNMIIDNLDKKTKLKRLIENHIKEGSINEWLKSI